MEIKPWALYSEAPWGGTRSGGWDQRCFAFSPDGKSLVTEDAGGWQLELWEVATGKSLGRFGRIEDPVALAFSPDGKTVVTAGSGWHGQDAYDMVLWDIGARKRLHSLDEGVNDTPFSNVAFSGDGKTLALAGNSPVIHLFDMVSGEMLRPLDGLFPLVPDSDGPKIDGLAFAPDGKSLALVCDQQVLLVEVATGKLRCLLGVELDVRDPNLERPLPRSMDFSPDGRLLAVACPGGLIRLWEVVEGMELLPLAGHEGGARAVHFLDSGKTLVSYGWDNRSCQLGRG